MENKISFLSDAINAIADLARKPLEESKEIITKEFFGRPYYKNKEGQPVPMPYPETSTPVRREYNSLDALVAMIREEALNLTFPVFNSTAGESICYTPKLFVVVSDQRSVFVRTSSEVRDYNAVSLYRALCDVTASFTPGRQYDHETFMILLRSQFQPSEDRDYLLELLSSVTSEATVKSEDNGLGQQVSVNTGIRNVQMRPIKSIVCLRPYRTFQEIEQPESEFLVRLSVEEGGAISIALHEADGGMWKLDARRKIAAYLANALREEIDAGRVVVTA